MPGHDPCLALRQLLETMHTLRAPGGCPWDREQTPESLAPYILEEACEVIDAIENGTPQMVADELGDLLLQIVFQAEIFSERSQFDFADIAAAINSKLLRRHPHVFDGINSCTSGTVDLDRQWEIIKGNETTSQAVSPQHPLGRIPGNLPALQRAQKLVSKIRRKGLNDTVEALPVLATKTTLTEEQLGEALIMLVVQADASGLDAEQALRRTTRNLMRSIAHPTS